MNINSILLFRGDVVHAGSENKLNAITRRIHTYVAVDPETIPTDNVFILARRRSDTCEREVILADAPKIQKLILENKISSKFMYADR